MDFDNLRTRLFRWLPIFLTLTILMGIALFAIRTVLPRLQTFEGLTNQVEAQRALISTRTAEQDNSANIAILNHQIEGIQENLDEVGRVFLTKAESEQVLNRLYDYAYSRGVRVTNLQAQQPVQPSELTSPYETSVYQLQVRGGIANLIDFVSYFHEASLPSVSIASITIARTGDQALLSLGLLIYTSPYASGEALNQIPTPLPTLMPTATRVPPTETPTETPTPSPTTTAQVTAAPTATMTATLIPPTATPTLTITPSLTPTPLATLIDCPGAPATQFKEGDVVIVHFEDVGALRLLSDPNGSVMGTRTQAYDNDRLEIITGPVCGTGALYWYVRNTTRGDALGWAAEGKESERWMCPEANPECIG